MIIIISSIMAERVSWSSREVLTLLGIMTDLGIEQLLGSQGLSTQVKKSYKIILKYSESYKIL